MSDFLPRFIQAVNHMVWGFPALFAIGSVGLYFTVKTRCVQLRKLPFALKSVFRKLREKPTDGVSPFQALCTALAATVGTGNIAGVAGAISIGGPGAIFWMWVAALLGMVVKYAEVVLAVRYRQQAPDGSYRGGPMYYIRDGLKPGWRWLGVVFCVFGIVAAFGVGNSTQVSTAVASVEEALAVYGVSPAVPVPLLMGLVFGLLVGLVIFGGAKRIGAVAEYLIPVMSLGYILLGAGVLLQRASALPTALLSIVSGAFNPSAVTGGAVGSCFIALRTGFSRGVFTNEAGMGTASIAHAGANISHPVQQGLYGIFEVFADTLVICTVTALVILTAQVPIPYGQATGAELTISAFTSVYGQWVSVFLALSMVLFSFATILGWGLYGIRCTEFLFGNRGWYVFAALHTLTTVLGALAAPALLWDLAETVNGLMAIPNLVALAFLSKEVILLTTDYFNSKNHIYLSRRHKK